MHGTSWLVLPVSSLLREEDEDTSHFGEGNLKSRKNIYRENTSHTKAQKVQIPKWFYIVLCRKRKYTFYIQNSL